MDKVIIFEDLKTKFETSNKKDKLELEKKMIKLAKDFIDCLSDLVQIEKNITREVQVFNMVFENQVRLKRFIEECGLSSDLSVRVTYNAKIDDD